MTSPAPVSYDESVFLNCPVLAMGARITSTELRSLNYVLDLIGLMAEWQRANP